MKKKEKKEKQDDIDIEQAQEDLIPKAPPVKQLMENWRKFVAESVEKPLGKYVWPSAIKGHPMADEPDTDVEEMLYQQLHNHFGAIAPLSDEATEVIKQILDSGQYEHVFQRVKRGTAMRGMRLPLDWLEKHAPEALLGLPTERASMGTLVRGHLIGSRRDDLRPNGRVIQFR